MNITAMGQDLILFLYMYMIDPRNITPSGVLSLTRNGRLYI